MPGPTASNQDTDAHYVYSQMCIALAFMARGLRKKHFARQLAPPAPREHGVTTTDRSMEDRRKFRRIPLVTEVRYRPLQEATPQRLTSLQRLDLGEGGMFVPTEEPLPAGTYLALEFTVPTSMQPLNIVGRVAWTGDAVKGKGMGIEFYDLDPHSRLELLRFAQRGEWAK